MQNRMMPDLFNPRVEESLEEPDSKENSNEKHLPLTQDSGITDHYSIKNIEVNTEGRKEVQYKQIVSIHDYPRYESTACSEIMHRNKGKTWK